MDEPGIQYEIIYYESYNNNIHVLGPGMKHQSSSLHAIYNVLREIYSVSVVSFDHSIWSKKLRAQTGHIYLFIILLEV